jgi:hypothetical protein
MTTSLLNKNTQDLIKVIKEKHKPVHFHNMKNIIHDMGHALYHDNRVNHIYNKTEVIEESLRDLFVNDYRDQRIRQERKKAVDDSYETVNWTLEHYRLEKKRNETKNRSSCLFTCF